MITFMIKCNIMSNQINTELCREEVKKGHLSMKCYGCYPDLVMHEKSQYNRKSMLIAIFFL